MLPVGLSADTSLLQWAPICPAACHSEGASQTHPAVGCLQEELPGHDEMKIGGHNGFMPYKAVAQMMAASLSGPVTQEVRSSLLPALRMHMHCPRSSKPHSLFAM